MDKTQRDIFGQDEFFPIVFCISLIVYLLFQYSLSLGIAVPPRGQNDDVMRLLSVRDLLAGQAWFDTTQYRVLPPEGISIHWSRLIDAPIAALNIIFRFFTTPQIAEAWAAATWPALLFILFLALTGRVTRSVFGTSAACFAMIAAATMPMLSANIFSFGHVDHHNVQAILTLGICAALIVPGPPVVRGVQAGLAAALSLAVGLETVFVVAIAGAILTVQHVIRTQGCNPKLIGFGLALAVGAPLLFVLQTGRASWGDPVCDQLGLPLLAVTTAGGVFTVLTVLVTSQMQARMARTVASMVVGLVCLAVAAPFIGDCTGGPYAGASAEVQKIISESIFEALPIYRILQMTPLMGLSLMLPFALVWFWAALILLRGAARDGDRFNRQALAIVFAFLSLSVFGAFWQLRAFNWGLSILPMAFGVVFAGTVNRHWQRLRAIKPIVLIVASVAVIMPRLLIWPAASALSMSLTTETDLKSGQSASEGDCNDHRYLSALNDIAPSLIQVPLNLGPHVLLYTHHSVTAAPYHRSANAMSNGVLPYFGNASDMANAVRRSDADLVLICTSQNYGGPESIGSQLKSGKLPAWLDLVEIDAGPNRLFRVRGDDGGDLN